jgi:histone-lysine N-methyltransferase SETMAR
VFFINKENFRFYIKVRTALNIQPTTINDELRAVFGDEAPSFRTVAIWAQWFREAREEIDDKQRPSRPVTETTPENIEQVRSIVSDDPYVTIEELQEQTGQSYGIVRRILSDHLKLRKVTARYIPKELTDFQRSERVQICKENLSSFEEGR